MCYTLHPPHSARKTGTLQCDTERLSPPFIASRWEVPSFQESVFEPPGKAGEAGEPPLLLTLASDPSCLFQGIPERGGINKYTKTSSLRLKRT